MLRSQWVGASLPVIPGVPIILSEAKNLVIMELEIIHYVQDDEKVSIRRPA